MILILVTVSNGSDFWLILAPCHGHPTREPHASLGSVPQEFLTTAMQIQAASLNEAATMQTAPGMGQQNTGMQTMGGVQEQTSPMPLQQSPMGMQQSPSPMGMQQQQPSLTQGMMQQQPMQPTTQANVPHLRT